MVKPQRDLAERVSGLESTVDALAGDLRAFQNQTAASLRAIQETIASNSRPNWSAIISAVMLLVALYAAAVRPLVNDVARLEGKATALADALLRQAEAIADNRSKIDLNGATIEGLRREFETVRAEGSPITDRRLSLIELKLGLR